ncbi:hypothetical protein [Streptomyces sp. NPDC048496]
MTDDIVGAQVLRTPLTGLALRELTLADTAEYFGPPSDGRVGRV